MYNSVAVQEERQTVQPLERKGAESDADNRRQIQSDLYVSSRRSLTSSLDVTGTSAIEKRSRLLATSTPIWRNTGSMTEDLEKLYAQRNPTYTADSSVSLDELSVCFLSRCSRSAELNPVAA